MVSKLILFAGAVHAALATASLDADTRITQYLKGHTGVTKGNGHPIVERDDFASTIQNWKREGFGNAVIGNRCDYDVWLWSVDQNGSSDRIHIPARSRHTEPFRNPCNGCGVSMKISKTEQIENSKHTQFEYAIADNQIYYDISFVDCAQGESAENCPGHEAGLAIDSPEEACGRFNCAGGSYCPTESYYVDQPLIKLGIEEPVKGCGGAGTGMEIYF